MPQHDVCLFGGDPGLLLLFFVKAGHTLNSEAERRSFIRRNHGKSCFNFFCSDFQCCYRICFKAVEAARQFQYSLITTFADVGDNIKYDLFDFAATLFAARKNSGEPLVKIGIVDVEKKHGLPCSVRLEQLLQSLYDG